MTDVPTVKVMEKITALKAEVRLHKEIADAREFDFHQAEKRIAQAYQVIGALSSHFDAFEHPDVQRALDYFSGDKYDPEFLPWVMR